VLISAVMFQIFSSGKILYAGQPIGLIVASEH